MLGRCGVGVRWGEADTGCYESVAADKGCVEAGRVGGG